MNIITSEFRVQLKSWENSFFFQLEKSSCLLRGEGVGGLITGLILYQVSPIHSLDCQYYFHIYHIEQHYFNCMSMNGNISDIMWKPLDLRPSTASESVRGEKGGSFPQANPNSNSLPPCNPNLSATSFCEQKSNQNQPKNNITIVEAESDQRISLPADQRNYGISQPTEILLAMPQETDHDPPIRTGSHPSCEVKTGQEEPVVVEVICHNQLAAGSNMETEENEHLQSWEVAEYGSTTILVSEEVDSKPPEVKIKSQLTRHKKAKDAIIKDICREFEEVCTDSEGGAYKDSCCRGCIGCCFQSVSCTASNPCGRSRSSPISVSKKEQLLNTAALTKARKRGWDHFKKAIFPLVSDTLRVLWVFIELILLFSGLIISITGLFLDQNQVFKIIHLVLAIVPFILAVIDAYKTFILKKICCKKCSTENVSEAGDCKKCYSRCTNLFDVMRAILSEVVLYPLLIFDIFDVITGRGFEKGSSGENRLGFAHFVITLIAMALSVYVARIVVLVGVVKNASAVRTPPKDITTEDLQESGYDQAIKKSAVCYQGFFCVYVILQMLTQLLMYIAIGAKIRYDNRHFYYADNTDQTIQFTSFLIYMIVAGYLLPFLGLLNFFIVTFYWSQQYPIGFRLDMLSISKMSTYSITDLLNPKKMVKDKVDSLNEKAVSQVFDPLKNDFMVLFQKGFFDKFSYPFNSPTLVFICILYTALQAAFVVCASEAVDEMGSVFTHILNGGGWVIYYIIAIIFGVIANFYAFLVVGFWILVISIILLVFIGLFALFLILYIFSGCEFEDSRHDD